MTKEKTKVLHVQTERIKMKLKKSSPLYGLSDCILSLIKIANSNYWLHPEYDSPNDYIICELSIKYPCFEWFYCSRKKQISIKI